MRRLLITGAAGEIGRQLRKGLRDDANILRLSDIAPLGAAQSCEEILYADLRDLGQLTEAMTDVDAVVHLGGERNENTWDVIRDQNIDGIYNVLEAARLSNVRRVVYASSAHATGFYPRTQTIDVGMPYRADSLYGASKAFGEVLGRLYADKYGLQIVCLRIGKFSPQPNNIRCLSIWISPRDLTSLVRASLTAADVHFEIVYGCSANSRSWWDDSGAVKIGYRPQDNAEIYAEAILAQGSEDAANAGKLFQGGYQCDDPADDGIDRGD